KNRDEFGMGEQWRKITGGTPAGSECDEDYEQCKGAEGSPVLKAGSKADAAKIKSREQPSQRNAHHQSRQKHRPAANLVQRNRIENGKNVCANAADRNRFPRANDEVCQQHHPPSSV